MAATIADFVVRQGIVVQATNAVTSSTAQTAALQVNSGAAIAKNLIVGTTATIWGPITVYGSSTLAAVSASGITTFTNNTNATSANSGAVQVTGGVGIAQDLWVGGTIYGVAGITGTVTTASNLAGGAAGQIPIQSAAGRTSFIPTGSAGQLLQAGTNTATFVSTSTIYVDSAVNAERLRGGAIGNIVYQTGAGTTGFVTNGTAGQVLVSTGNAMPVYQNTLTLAGTTQATSTNSGALQVAGGVGIGGNLYVGGEIVAQKLTIQLTTITTTLVTTDDIISTYNTTQSTSTTTGALQVAGGAGIGGNLFVGGTINAAGGLTGTITTATNLAGGTAGVIAYQTAPGVTSFIGTGTTGSILQMGANTATFVTTSSIYVNSSVNAETLRGGTAGQLHYQSAVGVTSFLSTGTQGQLLMSQPGAPAFTNTASIYVGAATSSVNLFGGAGGSLPYQSSAGVTTFLSIGGNGFVLTSNGSTPTWSALTGLSAGSATTASNLANGTAGQVPYQIAAGQTGFYGPGTAGQVLVSGGTGTPTYQSTLTLAGTTAVSSTNTGALQVGGGVGIAGGLFVGGVVTATNIVNITNTTAATSTSTGALTVAGGVGIGGTLYVGPSLASTVVPALFSNNTLLASYTSGALSASVQANLDAWSTSTYTSAKYFIQVRQQSSPNIHITEMTMFVDGNGSAVYLNEYGTAWSSSSLGTFDASIVGGNATLQFTPNQTVTVKVVRLTLTT